MGDRDPGQDPDRTARPPADPLTPPPSGRQYEIAHGDQRAVAVEIGGGLRVYEHAGFGVLDGYAEDAMCGAARGQPLIPWPNRIADGRYEFAGRQHQLALTEPSRRTAIHGLLRWVGWRAVDHAPEGVTLEAEVPPQPGYPFRLLARVAYALGGDGLRVSMTARNSGSAALPYGCGQHPYVRAAGGLIDGQTVRSPARTRLVVDERGIPTGERVPVAGEHDLSSPERLGERVLDTPYTDLERDADGRARVRVASPEREVVVWLGAGFEHLMLFTGDTLAPDERRRGLGVEPMTCPPNAFQAGDARVLEPGEEWTVEWGISVSSR